MLLVSYNVKKIETVENLVLVHHFCSENLNSNRKRKCQCLKQNF